MLLETINNNTVNYINPGLLLHVSVSFTVTGRIDVCSLIPTQAIVISNTSSRSH
jgi:hypothetical protein